MGGLVLIYTFEGPMFAGKTSALVEAAQGLGEIKAFKPMLDNRYSKNDIVTHDGKVLKARAVKSPLRIDVKAPLFLDEVQFFDRIELALLVAFRQTAKLDTYLSFLDFYSNGEKTPPALMFDEYEKNNPAGIKRNKFLAVCKFCGANAPLTLRLADNKDNNFIGGAESYAPACVRCWAKIK